MKASPNTTVLVDEAYFEYGTMAGYETFIPTAVENPRVIVARTFSKCFGMAGLRIGYAIGHKDTIAKMGDWDDIGNISVMALQGAKAALAVPDAWVKDEQKRNAEARTFTQKWFADRGYPPTDSQTNFMFVEHQAAVARLPRGVPQGRRARRPRLPALREDPRADLGRHHGRDAEGGAGVRASAGHASQGGCRLG